jgi:hypothetical protein
MAQTFDWQSRSRAHGPAAGAAPQVKLDESQTPAAHSVSLVQPLPSG